MSARVAMAEPPSVKGWCPGALRPMQTGDGLIVRVRPRCGALSAKQALVVSEVARCHGNGLVDLTRRANIQIRGVDARDLAHVWSALSEGGLIDAHADAEAVRNVMVSPLTGVDPTEVYDVRPTATALETALSASTRPGDRSVWGCTMSAKRVRPRSGWRWRSSTFRNARRARACAISMRWMWPRCGRC